MSTTAPSNTLLGKTTDYVDSYAPHLLTPIPRSLGRSVIGRDNFRGTDIWRLYEITWIDARGLPQVAAGEIRIPATSPCIVESKSLKLYIGSLTQTVIGSVEEAAALIARDVGKCVGADVTVDIAPVAEWNSAVVHPEGVLLEADVPADVTFSHYEVTPELIQTAPEGGTEDTVFVSDLLRSRCPVTGQPDHASVIIQYTGPKVDRAALLAYIVSFRRHQGFHEQCCEQIFNDLLSRLNPSRLSVFACFTRRGGIDISPFRSTEADLPESVIRTVRQ